MGTRAWGWTAQMHELRFGPLSAFSYAHQGRPSVQARLVPWTGNHGFS